MSEYPEHDKLQAVADESQAIGEFLDLGRWTLCEADDRRGSYVAVDIQEVLAEYFGIDRAALEREKRAMLAAIRHSSQRPDTHQAPADSAASRARADRR